MQARRYTADVGMNVADCYLRFDLFIVESF